MWLEHHGKGQRETRAGWRETATLEAETPRVKGLGSPQQDSSFPSEVEENDGMMRSDSHVNKDALAAASRFGAQAWRPANQCEAVAIPRNLLRSPGSAYG